MSVPIRWYLGRRPIAHSVKSIEVDDAKVQIFYLTLPQSFFYPYIDNINMKPTRDEKINRMLQKELGDILLFYAKKLQGVLISVSEVKVSTDLAVARVYLSIFPEARAAEVFAQVEADGKMLRFELGRRVRHQLRVVPEITFVLDDTLNYLDNIDRLLKG